MKNVCYAILFVGLMIGASCVDAVSPVVKLFKEHLEREISLEGFYSNALGSPHKLWVKGQVK